MLRPQAHNRHPIRTGEIRDVLEKQYCEISRVHCTYSGVKISYTSV